MGQDGRPSAAASHASSKWTAAIVVTLAGVAHAFAFAPWHAWWLQLLAVAVLAQAVWRARPVRSAVLGWLFSMGWLLSGIWWLFISMYRYGGLPAWLSALAVVALCAFLSLYLALAMAAFARWRPAAPALAAGVFAACWVLAEWGRATLFTGFPWLAAGYAHSDGPLAGWAPWIGVLGLGGLGAAVAALAVAALRGWRTPGQRGLAAALGLAALVGVLSGPAVWRDFTTPTGTLSLELLQGNVPQEEKFSRERVPEQLQWYAQAIKAADSDLVIAPETALPVLPRQLPEGYWRDLLLHIARGHTHVLIGLPLGDPYVGYTNSVAGLWPGQEQAGAVYRYDKHHLVPFGEFIPPGFRWFVDMMNMPLGDFDRGVRNAPSFTVNGERVAPNICYEDLFGEELAARFVEPAQAPTVFANVSNIAWFGPTIAIDQHLQISRLRALEFQRPMVRATNTGATAVIDHLGRVTHALPPHTRGVLRAQVQGREGLTPYARWASRHGHLPLGVLALLAVLGAAFSTPARAGRAAP